MTIRINNKYLLSIVVIGFVLGWFFSANNAAYASIIWSDATTTDAIFNINTQSYGSNFQQIMNGGADLSTNIGSTTSGFAVYMPNGGAAEYVNYATAHHSQMQNLGIFECHRDNQLPPASGDCSVGGSIGTYHFLDSSGWSGIYEDDDWLVVPLTSPFTLRSGYTLVVSFFIDQWGGQKYPIGGVAGGTCSMFNIWNGSSSVHNCTGIPITKALINIYDTSFTPPTVYFSAFAQSYSLPIDPLDGAISAWFDHDSTNSQMTKFDGNIYYGANADIPGCTAGCYDNHHGIDFSTSGQEEKPILAATDGVVAFKGWENPSDINQGYGYHLRLYHAQSGQSTVYAHATTTQSFVSVSDTVTRGETILLSGNTGQSTGPHLHFGVFDNNSESPAHSIDPYGWSGGGSDPRTNDLGYLWATNPPSL